MGAAAGRRARAARWAARWENSLILPSPDHLLLLHGVRAHLPRRVRAHLSARTCERWQPQSTASHRRRRLQIPLHRRRCMRSIYSTVACRDDPRHSAFSVAFLLARRCIAVISWQRGHSRTTTTTRTQTVALYQINAHARRRNTLARSVSSSPLSSAVQSHPDRSSHRHEASGHTDSISPLDQGKKYYLCKLCCRAMCRIISDFAKRSSSTWGGST